MIGAYYQCYKQPKAFLHTIASFRKHYPTQSLYIVCDNGLDFSNAAKAFNATYIHDTLQSGNNVTNQLASLENAKRYLLRFFEGARHIKEPYFILLEDDVHIFHPIPESICVSDMVGCNRDSAVMYPQIVENLRKYNPEVESRHYYGGCGGTLFRTEFFKSLHEKITKTPNMLDDILQEYKTINDKFDSDILLSYLTLRFHGTVTGPPTELSEPYYHNLSALIQRGYICVLHQYKEFYNKPLTMEETQLLGWKNEGAPESDVVLP